MPSARRQKPKSKRPRPKPPARAAPARTKAAPSRRPSPARSRSGGGPAKATAKPAVEVPVVRRADGRIHVLSLSFVRDGDEFLARLETDSGQITELKNRSLDQLLTLVASELEDLLE
jgi:hypothetical protein